MKEKIYDYIIRRPKPDDDETKKEGKAVLGKGVNLTGIEGVVDLDSDEEDIEEEDGVDGNADAGEKGSKKKSAGGNGKGKAKVKVKKEAKGNDEYIS